jgi:hypothetical protein
MKMTGVDALVPEQPDIRYVNDNSQNNEIVARDRWRRCVHMGVR